MINASDDKKHNIFLNILFFGVIVSIAVSFYNFYYKKNYDFYVETQCNPDEEICFYRDCENDPDICPPNNFTYYNQYIIKAKDFKFCDNEDCGRVCKSGEIHCVKVGCSLENIENGVCVDRQKELEKENDSVSEI